MDGNQANELYSKDEAYWRRTLGKALPDFRCRACGSANWEVHSLKEAGVLNWFRNDGSLRLTLLTIPFICKNCGLTEVFSPDELERLAERNDG